jgi:hypothetical protein
MAVPALRPKATGPYVALGTTALRALRSEVHRCLLAWEQARQRRCSYANVQRPYFSEQPHESISRFIYGQKCAGNSAGSRSLKVPSWFSWFGRRYATIWSSLPLPVEHSNSGWNATNLTVRCTPPWELCRDLLIASLGQFPRNCRQITKKSSGFLIWAGSEVDLRQRRIVGIEIAGADIAGS